MIHDEKKVANILEELTMYFFSIGGDKISTCIEKGKEEVKIVFRANYLPEYEENIQYLENALSTEKNEGMEDIFWELAGSGDPGESSQLILIGMMVDRYELHRLENEIELCMYKTLDMEW